MKLSNGFHHLYYSRFISKTLLHIQHNLKTLFTRHISINHFITKPATKIVTFIDGLTRNTRTRFLDEDFLNTNDGRAIDKDKLTCNTNVDVKPDGASGPIDRAAEGKLSKPQVKQY